MQFSLCSLNHYHDIKCVHICRPAFLEFFGTMTVFIHKYISTNSSGKKLTFFRVLFFQHLTKESDQGQKVVSVSWVPLYKFDVNTVSSTVQTNVISTYFLLQDTPLGSLGYSKVITRYQHIMFLTTIKRSKLHTPINIKTVQIVFIHSIH